MMMTAMAISPMMRNVLSVATMLPTDVMASDTATIAPTIVPMIRRMSPLCAPGPLAGYGRAGPSRIWRWAHSVRYVLARSRLCKWAHMLGHGHFLTKSRRYSTTFGQLRRDRQTHRRAQRHPLGEHDPWGRPLDDAVVLVLHTWTYAGVGYTTTPAAELALASADRARAYNQAVTVA
jgi:Replication initiator protein, pSAM2